MKHVKESFIGTYIKSCSKNGNNIDHTKTFRTKYIGKTGIIFIINNKEKQYFQFHPQNENGEIQERIGLVSSNDDYTIKSNILTIETQWSIYTFKIKNISPINITPEIIY